MLRGNAEKYDAIGADVSAALDNTSRIAEMMAEVLPLIRRAAPLLDSPMAKMATTSPAAAALSWFGGRRG
ncbi:hypothetical protein B446_35953 (plasmid) [Streptomyces collinus Tu 365]|uniref:Uncharacterized protein n=2 Tax=Streptomyces collinus TaxID=42684 RepID=S5VFE1_STRC3|nr:hypothetical protein B446_35953 [Streptomyces collinus Tu 365]